MLLNTLQSPHIGELINIIVRFVTPIPTSEIENTALAVLIYHIPKT